MTTRKRGGRTETPEFVEAMRADADGTGPAPLCAGREAEYVDYDASPSQDEAEEMCVDCPLYLACRKSAELVRPAWGVWGGIAWEGGKRAHLRRTPLESFC